jgi:thiamine-monophosphate kinase
LEHSLDIESYWIKKIKTPYIGDDGALIDEWVYAMDAFWENSHFKREWMRIEQIAYKAFMVNLSDMVAMNAETKYMLLTVAFPKDIKKSAVKRLSKEFNRLALEHKIEIIGGDTIGSDKLGISITMIGKTKVALKRDSLKSGDLIAYTGELGSVKRDLELLFEGERIPDNSKFYKPILRQDFTRAATPWLSAGMDISDGLYCDTNKFLKANDLFMKPLKVIEAEIGESGEEYEMLIAFPPENLERIQKIARLTQTPLTIFATATEEPQELYPCGSQHFS